MRWRRHTQHVQHVVPMPCVLDQLNGLSDLRTLGNKHRWRRRSPQPEALQHDGVEVDDDRYDHHQAAVAMNVQQTVLTVGAEQR